MTDYTQKAERDRIRSWVEKEYEVQSSYVEDLLDACDKLEQRIAKLEAAQRETANAERMLSNPEHLDP